MLTFFSRFSVFDYDSITSGYGSINIWKKRKFKIPKATFRSLLTAIIHMYKLTILRTANDLACWLLELLIKIRKRKNLLAAHLWKIIWKEEQNNILSLEFFERYLFESISIRDSFEIRCRSSNKCERAFHNGFLWLIYVSLFFLLAFRLISGWTAFRSY